MYITKQFLWCLNYTHRQCIAEFRLQIFVPDSMVATSMDFSCVMKESPADYNLVWFCDSYATSQILIKSCLVFDSIVPFQVCEIKFLL
jgi:hypothetical protein